MEGGDKRSLDYRYFRSQRQRGESSPRTDDFSDEHLVVKRGGRGIPFTPQAKHPIALIEKWTSLKLQKATQLLSKPIMGGGGG